MNHGKQSRNIRHRMILAFSLLGALHSIATAQVDLSIEPSRLGEGFVAAIALSPDGETLAAAHRTSNAGQFWQTHTVLLWNPETGERKGELRVSNVDGIAYSPDGTLLALASSTNRSIHLWDTTRQNEVAVIQTGTRSSSLAFSPDGKTLASSASFQDSAVQLWDVQTQLQVGTLQGDSGKPLWPVAFSPDGQLLATGGTRGDEAIRLWDFESRTQVAAMMGHLDGTNGLAFNADGSILASAGGWNDQAVYLWDVPGRVRLGVLGGHSAHVGSAAFSPDGRLLASTVYWDDTVHIWDVAAQEELGVLTGHDATDFGWSDQVLFSQNGRWLVCSGDNGITLWEVNLHSPGAARPSPSNGETDVYRRPLLEWMPGEFAKLHDVYLGTEAEDIRNAEHMDPAYQGRQEDISYAVSEPLELGTTYYWRVDEVNGPPDYTIFKGDVWSFTAEPIGYPLIPIAARASSVHGRDTRPLKTIDGSGLNASDQHSTELTDMWLSREGTSPAWIQYEFDGTYTLHEMWVWNANGAVESIVGFGAKDVTIDTSVDGQTWTSLEQVPQFAQAPGTVDYTHNTVVEFNGRAARFVRLTIHNGWGTFAQYGLSEIRFFHVPTQAREQKPLDGTILDNMDVTLRWRPGRTATLHEVLLSDDPAALSDGSAVVAIVDENRYTPDPLNYGTTYTWQVNEINEAADPAVSMGVPLTFTTPEAAVIDDMESYRDREGQEIWATWKDGYDTPDNGSTVGENPTQDYFGPETRIVRGGNQSLPIHFDNTGVVHSEATRTFDQPRDWTKHGTQGLVLYFQGSSVNTGGQLYVKINQTRVNYPGDPQDLMRTGWHKWYIPIADVPESPTDVVSLAIGIDQSGVGIVYIDDILLTPKTRELIVPTEPGSEGLVAHYAFEDDVTDSTGQYPGTLMGWDMSFVPGKLGQALELSGDGGYVETDQSAGALGIGGANPRTICAWVLTRGFNNGGIYEMGRHTDGQDFSLRTTGVANLWMSQHWGGDINFTVLSENEWVHFAHQYENENIRVYANGVLVAEGQKRLNTANGPKTFRIGVWDTKTFDGLIDELRVYARALSREEIAGLAGLSEPFDIP